MRECCQCVSAVHTGGPRLFHNSRIWGHVTELFVPPRLGSFVYFFTNQLFQWCVLAILGREKIRMFAATLTIVASDKSLRVARAKVVFFRYTEEALHMGILRSCRTPDFVRQEPFWRRRGARGAECRLRTCGWVRRDWTRTSGKRGSQGSPPDAHEVSVAIPASD